MYFDADLHLATKRLLLAYQNADETQGIHITDLAGHIIADINNPYAQGPRWSPDGQKFAYFSNDGRLYVHNGIETEPAQVIEMPGYNSSFCEWSPGGDSLIFSAYATTQPIQPPNIYRYDFADSAFTQITNNTDVDRFPKWNHAGTQVACHRTYRDGGENQTGIVVVDLNDKREYVLPRPDGFSQRISRNCWSPDDQRLIVTEHRHDAARLAVYQIATGEVVWSGAETNIPISVDGCFDPYTGRIVLMTLDAVSIYDLPSQTAASATAASVPLYAQLPFSRAWPGSPTEPSSIKSTLAGPVIFFAPHEEAVYFLGGDFRFYRWQMHGTCEVIIRPELPKYDWTFELKQYEFRASDGLNVTVHQYIPPNSNGRAILFVEGGPGEPMRGDHPIVMRLLAEGYEVIRPAYRGIGGFGRAHAQANEGECGRADVRDVVECGIDWRKRFDKPDAPLAVSGFSYGGYLTFLALTHPDAVWTCGITFWGATMMSPLTQTTGLPQDADERRKALEERSPARQAHRIRFPLLILHGDRDTSALTEAATMNEEVKLIRDRVRTSNVRCDLIVFEGESHGLKGCRPQMYAHTLKFLDEIMGEKRMKKIIWTRYGPPEVLELREVEKPTPQDDEILIKVRASSVTLGDTEARTLNFAWWLSLMMRLYVGVFKPLRMNSLGQELAGDVEAVGKDVTRFKPGDAVFGTTGFNFGAYAEYVCLREDSEAGVVALKPSNMSYEEAAAVPTGGLEALHFLRKGEIKSGEHLLINGGGGSIGTFTLQLAKHYGAEVTAVDKPEKFDMLRALGADHVIDYTREDFSRSDTKYDLVLDVVGKNSFSRCIRALKPDGRYLLANPRLSAFVRGAWISSRSDKKVIATPAGRESEDLLSLVELIEAGKLKTVIDRSYPLEQTAEAHRYVETGQKKGNVIITIG